MGDGTTETHFSLVSIGGELAAGVAVASFGNGCSSATKADGSLWTWGSNNYGQLGDGSGNDQHTPVKVMDGVALDMPAPRPASPFFDVPAGAWFAGVTSRAASLGVLNGYPNGNFGPNDRITRGQVAVALWKMANQPAGARDFPDVHEGDYFRDAVRWAGSVGVVNGYENGNFGPSDRVTREQLAAMMANCLSLSARNVVFVQS